MILRAAAPPPPSASSGDIDYNQVFKGGFPASTTIFASENPEKIDDRTWRVTSAEQAEKVILDGNAKVLIARRLDLKDEGAKKLAAALKKNKCLEEIYLSQNNIGPAGAKVCAITEFPEIMSCKRVHNLTSRGGGHRRSLRLWQCTRH